VTDSGSLSANAKTGYDGQKVCRLNSNFARLSSEGIVLLPNNLDVQSLVFS